MLSPCGTPPLYNYIEYSTRDHGGSERIDVAYVQARQTISIFMSIFDLVAATALDKRRLKRVSPIRPCCDVRNLNVRALPRQRSHNSRAVTSFHVCRTCPCGDVAVISYILTSSASVARFHVPRASGFR